MGGWDKKVMRGDGGTRAARVRNCGERGVKIFLKSDLDTGGILPLKEEGRMWCVWLMPHIKGTQTVYRPLERPKGIEK